MAIANGLSIVGCLFNFTTTIVLSTYKFTLGKMVIALSIMDFVATVISLLAVVKTENQYYCDFKSFWWFFGFNGSLAWTSCFAHGLYISTKSNNLEIIDSKFKPYAIVSTSIALILGTTGFFLKFYNSNICDPLLVANGLVLEMKTDVTRRRNGLP